MNELAICFGRQSLVGILCRPTQANGSAIVFVNAGSTHRCGPNRLYTNLARTLAERGYASLRFDIAGLGDSPPAAGLGKFRDYASQQVREAIDYLQTQGYRRMTIFGLCGGSDIAFDTGAIDERVDGLILANGALVDGDVFAGLYHEASHKTRSRFYAANMLSPRRWLRLVTFRSQLWKRLAGRTHSSSQSSLACGQMCDQMAAGDSKLKWEALAQRKVRLLLVYSQGSVFWDIFKMASKDYLSVHYPDDLLTVEFQKNTDHTFTLLSAQERLAVRIGAWLDAVSPISSRLKQAVTANGENT